MRPLLLGLAVFAVLMGSILAAVALIWMAVAGGGEFSKAQVWSTLRPVAVVGGILFAGLAAFRWLAFLFVLHRKLARTGVSLSEFAGWALKVRSAWLSDENSDQQPRKPAS